MINQEKTVTKLLMSDLTTVTGTQGSMTLKTTIKLTTATLVSITTITTMTTVMITMTMKTMTRTNKQVTGRTRLNEFENCENK